MNARSCLVSLLPFWLAGKLSGGMLESVCGANNLQLSKIEINPLTFDSFISLHIHVKPLPTMMSQANGMQSISLAGGQIRETSTSFSSESRFSEHNTARGSCPPSHILSFTAKISAQKDMFNIICKFCAHTTLSVLRTCQI